MEIIWLGGDFLKVLSAPVRNQFSLWTIFSKFALEAQAALKKTF